MGARINMRSPARHFTLFTGAPPYVNSNPAVVIGNHLSSEPPRLGTVRADLGSIDDALSKAMAKEPFQRFDTCREFASALAHAGSGGDTQFATEIPVPPRASTKREDETRGEAA